MKIACFSIASLNYTAQLSVLKESLELHHPEINFHIYLCDDYETMPEQLRGVSVTRAADIGIPDFEIMCGVYSTIEINTAIKPFCFAHLFIEQDYDIVFYIDPDILFLSPMSEAIDLLSNETSIILTPHTRAPIEDTKNPNDFDMAKAGIYNLGYCGVKNDKSGRGFIAWWCRKLARNCKVDLANGIFVDQKWCDAVPALFDNVHILKHDGYNIGYWNLMHRVVYYLDDKGWMANEDPIRFFHFSGLTMNDSNSVSKHQNRLFQKHFYPDLRHLFALYRSKMMKFGYFNWVKRKPKFNNSPILDDPLIHECTKAYLKYVEGKIDIPFKEFLDHLPYTFYLSNLTTTALPIPDLFIIVWCLRSDLQQAFDISQKSEALNFVNWVSRMLVKEYSFTDEYAEKISKTFILYHVVEILQTNEKKYVPYKTLAIESSDWKKYIISAERFINWADVESDEKNSISLPFFLQVVFERRDDLKVFNIKTHEGKKGLLLWAKDCYLKEVGNLFDEKNALYPLSKPKEERKVKQTSEAIRKFLKKDSFESGYYPLFATSPHSSLAPVNRLQDGISLIGYPFAEMGMGEHVRNTASALMYLKTSFEIFNANTGLTCSCNDKSFEEYCVELPSQKVNLFHVNADQVIMLDNIIGSELFHGRYNIGYWAWELSSFPSAWEPAIDLMDELWAPTEFIREALKKSTSKPVYTVPLRVAPGLPSKTTVYDFGVPENSFTFLFFFDFSSYIARKNPWAIIQAFRKAFAGMTGELAPRLVIKTIGHSLFPKEYAQLVQESQHDNRIHLINQSVSRADMNGLLSSSSCFVSMHRSEGFGRGVAEAMYFEKPVIATGYSGNTDFMNNTNSYLIDYKLVPVPDDAYIYPSGSLWANPSTTHAAMLMLEVFTNSAGAARKAKSAAEYMRKEHSTEAIAQTINLRLRHIL